MNQYLPNNLGDVRMGTKHFLLAVVTTLVLEQSKLAAENLRSADDSATNNDHCMVVFLKPALMVGV